MAQRDDPAYGAYGYDPQQAPDNTGITGGALSSPSSPAPATPWDRTGFRDAWMGSSGSMDNFLTGHPEYAGVQAVNGKNGTYQLPSGELMDLQIAKGLNGDNAQHGWTGVGEVHNGQPSYYAQNGGSVPGTLNGGNGAASGGATSPLNGPMRDAILAQLTKAQQPVTAADETVKPSIDAYRAESTRGLEDTQRALAERAYATGNLGQGGYDQIQQQAREKAGLGMNQFAGQAVQQAQGQRQALLQQLLGMGNSNLQLNDNLGLGYAKLGQDQNQFGQSLGLQYSQLGQQNQQFNDNLGYNYANMQSTNDRAALLAALGGS